MELSYLSDTKGKKTAVVIPIKQWNTLKRKNQDLKNLEEKEKQKKKLLENVRAGFREMKEINEGKKVGTPIEELLNEL